MGRPTRDEVAVFRTTAAFRTWLLANHHAADHLWVGYYRKSAGKAAMTYPQALEEALCFGWIDGITYRIDDEIYAVRWTPRRKSSNWSAPNIAKVAELTTAGRMHAAGLKAFEERDRRKDLPYLRDHPLRQDLPPEQEARIRANPAAWAYWQAQRASYRKGAAFWIQSAKQEATRERRLASLIEESAAGRMPKALRRPGEGA
ncbi:MAG TPA: YdeI/OmpD-associated family protein [Candidatus Limnocylindria bacterium]|nr:YdeI/OmpD-associated family protein [Candidatus Limnocylindria bacterium]